MSAPNEHHDPTRDADGPVAERLTELLAQRAVIGLDDAEVDELQAGLAVSIADGSMATSELDAFDELAARATLGGFGADDEPVPAMPTALRERLIADCIRVAHGRPARPAAGQGPVRRDAERAEAFIANAPAAEFDAPAPIIETTPAARPAPVATPAIRPAPEARSGVLATLGPWMGWAAAAAILVFTVLSSPDAGPPSTGGSGDIALASDLVELPLSGLAGVADGVTGSILWSAERQAGVLRVSGLAVNDPSKVQYQLWLFDGGREARSEQSPAVDGGVFDVPTGADTIEIPIDAKIEVFDPYLFAITSEPAGGVVKHDPALDPDRFRIVATAAFEG